MTGRDEAVEFGRFPDIYCEGAGGQSVELDNGGVYCGVWITEPPVRTENSGG